MFNSLVILSFWRSVQLRKKLCYFMIMVLSCCDLSCPRSTNVFLGFSLFALLVMNFDRYLATSYPIFHRTSVTKRRLLILLAILIIVEITLNAMSVNGFVISYQGHILIVSIIFFPAMLFINYKLFLVVRKSRKKKRISPEMKNISSCLLAVACGVVVSTPGCVYIGLRINSPETKDTLDNASLAGSWAITISLMNCTFNCLIFYWKKQGVTYRRIESSEKHENMSMG